MIQGKNILVGISGGIAAYKSPFLIRELIKKGYNVKVIATKNALEFVTLTTLKTLSNNNVYYDMFLDRETLSTEHISLTDWADCFIIAPATANIIGKIATGIADDALSTSVMAFNKPLFIAPSMNTKMYNNPIFKENIQKLKNLGANIISSNNGFLACGYDGDGRMEEPNIIVEKIEDYFSKSKDLEGKTIMVTASGTQEKIDAVRYIGNSSSGKMGYSIAKELASRGGKVILISGKTHLRTNSPNIDIINVVSAQDMYDEAIRHFPQCDIAILSAAVADYKPKISSKSKIKKTEQELIITLSPTKDILAHLGKIKSNEQVLIGFALETENEEENAKKKLKNKNLDFIVLNSLNDEGAGFNTPTNKIKIIDNKGNIESFPLKSKEEVAKDIVNKLVSL